jgi:WhiB family transcriptional regulator, redox-sensing transcriptional regulator
MLTATLLSDLEDMVASTAWMAYGLCSQTDPEAFFAPRDTGPNWYAAAVRVCSGCPVREICAAYAIENEIPYGVWGGLTEQERQPADHSLAA